eukprot:TRINITY_DN72219_c0_g1_i1.p1 TRINITY_DN72219_c0_g1~~TRINITY_DN72219_c0_g1_i1.p1  ORF type:complete len:700 (-),score=113.47 TRINITY_DN72219_c0_g1_i1:97-2196(-)
MQCCRCCRRRETFIHLNHRQLHRSNRLKSLQKKHKDLGEVVADEDGLSDSDDEDGGLFPRLRRAVFVLVFLAHLFTLVLETDYLDGSARFAVGGVNTLWLAFYFADIMQKHVTSQETALRSWYGALDGIILFAAMIERFSFFGASVLVQAISTFRILGLFRKPPEALLLVTGTDRRVRKTLTWAVLVTSVVIYTYAIIMRITVGDSARWNGTLNPIAEGFVHKRAEVAPFVAFDNQLYFGSTMKSFATVVQIITRANWADMGRRILKVYPYSFIFFVFMFMSTSYGLLLCVVSSICEDLLQKARLRELNRTGFFQEHQWELGRQAVRLMVAADENNDGNLSAEEIEQALQKFPEARPLLLSLGMPDHLCDPEGIIAMLDTSGEGLVSYEEFTSGLATLENLYRPYDMMKLQLRVWGALTRTQLLEQRCCRLQESISELTRNLQAAFTAVQKELISKGKGGSYARMVRQARRHLRERPPYEVPCIAGIRPPSPPKGLDALPTDEKAAFMARLERWGPTSFGPYHNGGAAESGEALPAPPPPPPRPASASAPAPPPGPRPQSATPKPLPKVEPAPLFAPPPLPEPRLLPPKKAQRHLRRCLDARGLPERQLPDSAAVSEVARLRRAREAVRALDIAKPMKKDLLSTETLGLKGDCSTHPEFRNLQRRLKEDLNDTALPGNPDAPEEWWKPPEARGKAQELY